MDSHESKFITVGAILIYKITPVFNTQIGLNPQHYSLDLEKFVDKSCFYPNPDKCFIIPAIKDILFSAAPAVLMLKGTVPPDFVEPFWPAWI